MKLLHMLSDVDNACVQLVKEAGEGVCKVVTKENVNSVNIAVLKQAGILVELKNHVKHELRMQTVAGSKLV